MNRKQGILGLLAGKTKKVATVEEMNEAAAAGWAGEEGGGNVYADLGYLDAAAMLDKARRVVRIAVAIEARQWSPEQAAAALDMTPLKLQIGRASCRERMQRAGVAGLYAMRHG